MAAEGEAVTLPVWKEKQSIEDALRAKNELKEECVNHLMTVGIVVDSPHVQDVDADNFKAAGRYSEERYINEIFSPNPYDISVKFSSDSGQKGMTIFFWGEDTTLNVWRAKPGTWPLQFAKNTKLLTGTRKDPKMVHAENLTTYRTVDIYGGAGFFTDPDSKKTGDPRMFFSPLCGFAITVEYHPTKTLAALELQRRLPLIINYRIDGLFSTTFSTSWQVIHALKLIKQHCPYTCSPLTTCSSARRP